MVYPINARNCCLMIYFLSKHGDVINQKLRHERKENGHLTNQRKHESKLFWIETKQTIRFSGIFLNNSKQHVFSPKIDFTHKKDYYDITSEDIEVHFWMLLLHTLPLKTNVNPFRQPERVAPNVSRTITVSSMCATWHWDHGNRETGAWRKKQGDRPPAPNHEKVTKYPRPGVFLREKPCENHHES